MKDKTQVFPLSKSDYVRTRLTHSLEVSCVGRSLGAVVGREIIARHGLKHVESGDFGAIVAAACLAHDIGNPPFGHAGEDAIREWFRIPVCWSAIPLRRPNEPTSSVTKAMPRAFASSPACRARPIRVCN
jgi:hypothetical protein